MSAGSEGRRFLGGILEGRHFLENLEESAAHFAGEEQVEREIKGRVEDERRVVEDLHPVGRVDTRCHADALDHHGQLAEHVAEGDRRHQILK